MDYYIPPKYEIKYEVKSESSYSASDAFQYVYGEIFNIIGVIGYFEGRLEAKMNNDFEKVKKLSSIVLEKSLSINE